MGSFVTIHEAIWELGDALWGVNCNYLCWFHTYFQDKVKITSHFMWLVVLCMSLNIWP